MGCGYWGINIFNTLKSLNVIKGYYDPTVDLDDRRVTKYNSFEELINDNDVTGVAIATPAATHYEIAKKCLLSKKSVFIEKPMCTNLLDAEKLGQLAIDNDCIISVGHLLIYHPHFVLLKELLKKNEIGKVQKVSAKRRFFGIRRIDEDVIWSFAPHDLSMIVDLFGSNIHDYSVIKRYFFNSDICDEAILSFKVNDIDVEIDLSWLDPHKDNSFKVIGTDGAIIFNDNMPTDKKLSVSKFDLKIDTLKKTQLVSRYPECEFKSPLTLELEDFIESINNKSQPKSSSDLGIGVVKQLHKIQDVDPKKIFCSL